MSILRDKKGNWSIFCDCCGDSIGVEGWDEAKEAKAFYGWKSIKINGEWQDVCKECLSIGNKEETK